MRYPNHRVIRNIENDQYFQGWDGENPIWTENPKKAKWFTPIFLGEAIFKLEDVMGRNSVYHAPHPVFPSPR